MTSVGKDVGKREPLCTLVGMYIGTATTESEWKFLKNNKNRTTIWSSNSTSGHLSEENEDMHLHENGVHTPSGILLSREKNETLLFVTTLEGIALSEITQTERDRYSMISLTCGRTDWWATEVEGGEMGEGNQKVQEASSYKISKSWRCKVWHGDHS